MAKIVSVMNWKEINIDAPVGKGGVNNKQDVLVVQAMLRYVMEYFSFFKNDTLPNVTGFMDETTLRAIVRFQRYVRLQKMVRISVDGRIDPSNGMYVGDRKRLQWTIGQLNGEASGVHIMQAKGGGTDHIEGIRNLYPQVDAILDGTAVGTLNLGLE